MKRAIFNILLFLILMLPVYLNAQWVRTYGGSESDRAYSVQQTTDGGYIVIGTTGSFQDSIYTRVWILKLDSGGTVAWQNAYSSTWSCYPLFIQETGSGGYVVAVYEDLPNDYFLEDEDIFVFKLNTSGDIVTGEFHQITMKGSPSCVQKTGDGGYIITGSTRSFGAGEEDIWVLKLGPSGDVEWQRTYGGIESDTACSIQEASGGGYIIVGSTHSFGEGEQDIWILKLTQTGEMKWRCNRNI